MIVYIASAIDGELNIYNFLLFCSAKIFIIVTFNLQ